MNRKEFFERIFETIDNLRGEDACFFCPFSIEEFSKRGHNPEALSFCTVQEHCCGKAFSVCFRRTILLIYETFGETVAKDFIGFKLSDSSTSRSIISNGCDTFSSNKGKLIKIFKNYISFFERKNLLQSEKIQNLEIE